MRVGRHLPLKLGVGLGVGEVVSSAPLPGYAIGEGAHS